jgi:hypothetical protein
MTHDAQNVLGKIWKDGFEHSLVDIDGNISATIASYLSSSDQRFVMELAAGHGTAPAEWSSLLHTDYGLDVSVVLSDLQPDTTRWNDMGLEFIPTSVDATNVSAIVKGTSSLRTGARVYVR